MRDREGNRQKKGRERQNDGARKGDKMIGSREVKRQNGVVKERDKVVGGRRKETKGNGQREKETK